MFARRLYEINLRLFREELARLEDSTGYVASDIVVVRDYINRLEAILAKMPDPISAVTVNIPAGRRHPFSVYFRAVHSQDENSGENVVRFPKRQIGQKQRELIGMLGCTVNDLGDVEWIGDEYA